MGLLRPAVLAAMEEASVVALAHAGEQTAFAELVRRRQAQIRALLRRLCREAALAEDLAQESFLRAWCDLATLKNSAAFGGWLRQVAVRIWLQHQRRHDPLALAENVSEEEGQETSTGERIDLDAALLQLAPAVRLCIVLAYQEGLSHGDIAEMSGLPLGTVKTHVRRGSALLRSLLQAYEPPGEGRDTSKETSG